MSALTQNNRLITINTPLGKDALIVRELEGQEALSQLFHFQLTLLSEDSAITSKKLLGQPVTIAIYNSGPDTPRYIHGHICRFAALDTNEGMKRLYRAEVVPALWFTTLGGQNRIFENKDFSDIINEVLGDYTTVTFKKALSGSYSKRRYCTQFEESDFEFISRLLAEEGVHYYFDHKDGSHDFCIADKANAFKPSLTTPVAYIGTGSNPLENSIHQWQHNYSYHTAEVEYRDYLPFSASAWIEKPSKEKSTCGSLNTAKPMREYFGRFDYVKEQDHTEQLPNNFCTQKARTMAENQEGQFDTADGRSTCCEFYAGGQFEVEHPIDSESGKYLLTVVRHTAQDSNDLGTRYSNHFTCIPSDIYAPPSPENFRRTVHTTQTAKVIEVKAAGEQGSDEFTQVKVQFPWKSKLNSCWIRVVQSYAGSNWGANFVPRVGQEVVVEYFNGNPDRPVVTGALYNSDNNGPKYSRTQSGWKSQWEGSKFNEMRLDDKKGAEEIYFEAGKDWNVLVHNDNTETVENDQTIEVTNNRDITVSKGNETKKVSKGTQKTTVQGAITIESKTSITLKVGSSVIKMTPSEISLKAMQIKSKSDTNTKIEAGVMMDVKGGAITQVKGALVKVN
ncbi:type VI secretion system tip protein VgrG [Sansalvadorimonas sp. 2012CJ34-2]|uniref:Type VI secretion system tip protein VgrG n=1 Tax=Parendozoicomonas callyspongiae TaxID=2942213 RepID=A0ABT0PE48_9GAMM|nr:type VI secretion system tip protein TssI/VgrG [Sansalvadorimonas sp. 2012CJ34-2]MCL6269321.1 type VI secretion system tip protein VgrG [Sansalvadorimonas sp. 2012CJ34-2]